MNSRFSKKFSAGFPFHSSSKLDLYECRYSKDLHGNFLKKYHGRINNYHADLNGKQKIAFNFLAKGGNSIPFSTERHREVEVEVNEIGIVMTIAADSFWTPSLEIIHNLLQTLSVKLIEHHYKPENTFGAYGNKMKWEMVMGGFSAGS